MLTRDTLLAAWPEPAELRETHVSLVVLTADRAFKFKKAVRLPFLDLTDPERRLALCHEEVRLNRELCPDIYLGVVHFDPATGTIGSTGEPAVEMRLLPEDRMVDHLLRQNAFDEVAAAIPEIVDRLIPFHAAAPRADEFGTPEAMAKRTFPILELAEQHLDPVLAKPIRTHIERGLAERAELFARRAVGGFVRDGHGDLHAANICLAPQGVRIYDRLEFSRPMRCGDVAFDLAFLAMSLDAWGARELSEQLRATYAERTNDPEFDALCSFLRVQRALVRANVNVMRGHAEERVRRYDHLAAGYALAPAAVLMCGLPASGKSTRARELAVPLGAEVVRSDVLRKKMVGMPLDERWEGGYFDGPYDPKVTEAVYAEVGDRTHALLDAGRSVIVDATLAKRRHREALIAGLGSHRWVLVHLVRTQEEIDRNLAARAQRPDVSDADRAVYEEAARAFEPPDEVAHKVVDRGVAITSSVLRELALER
ncbi:MAG: bifunctional aminoglycoside phosphotransferase/ATP-binding protein [Planctomycetota bacterium]